MIKSKPITLFYKSFVCLLARSLSHSNQNSVNATGDRVYLSESNTVRTLIAGSSIDFDFDFTRTHMSSFIKKSELNNMNVMMTGKCDFSFYIKNTITVHIHIKWCTISSKMSQ